MTHTSPTRTRASSVASSGIRTGSRPAYSEKEPEVHGLNRPVAMEKKQRFGVVLMAGSIPRPVRALLTVTTLGSYAAGWVCWSCHIFALLYRIVNNENIISISLKSTGYGG